MEVQDENMPVVPIRRPTRRLMQLPEKNRTEPKILGTVCLKEWRP
jgi:hypothetical protein